MTYSSSPRFSYHMGWEAHLFRANTPIAVGNLEVANSCLRIYGYRISGPPIRFQFHLSHSRTPFFLSCHPRTNLPFFTPVCDSQFTLQQAASAGYLIPPSLIEDFISTMTSEHLKEQILHNKTLRCPLIKGQKILEY